MKPWAGRGGLALLAITMLAPATAQAATADLSVTNSDSPDPVTEGATLTYTIDVENLGPETANEVKVINRHDSHVDFVSATSSQGTCEHKSRSVICSVGSLGTGISPYTQYSERATIAVTVKTKRPGQLTDTATVAVAKGDTDPNTANNSATQTTTVVAAGSGATCAGQAVTIVGTGGADTLLGTNQRDVIKARAGNDQIRALQSNDVVCAGGGDDIVRGGGGNDRLKGGAGSDLIKGGVGNDDLLGGPGSDRCRGGAGSDTKSSC
jgi:uncharacterized repeat protein (TIGR01451 family)